MKTMYFNLIFLMTMLFGHPAFSATSYNNSEKSEALNKVANVQFNSIYIDGDFDLVLTQDENCYIYYNSSEALLCGFTYEVNNGVLVIKSNSGIKQRLLIGFNHLYDLDINGSTTVSTIGQLKLDDAKISLNSPEKSSLNIEANDLKTILLNAGEVNLSGNIRSLILEEEGIGNWVSNDIEFDHLTIKKQGRNVLAIQSKAGFENSKIKTPKP